MSWLRNAVHRAVSASGQAGAKLVKIGRNYKSLKVTAKRLEEAALSYRGEERVQLLRRWLVALKETERALAAMRNPHHVHDPNRPVPVLDLYVEYETAATPMNFHQVFLYSQAIECILLSMILETPTEEECSLLLEIFGMCLNGGRDVHYGILTNIQDLGKFFSSYHDEVLTKRDELLQFAQSAISGLKINAEIARLDDEIVQLQQQISDAIRATSTSYHNKVSQTVAESFKSAVAEVRLCSRMEELVLKKKTIHPGDSLQSHFEKVDKLKVLSESLTNSSTKAEKRIMENRQQKEESLMFRVAKTTEVNAAEKDLETEISGLEKQKDQLEAELQKVNTKLHAAVKKLKKTREERDQFDEASNQILVHLKAKELELSRSVASCKAEASAVNAWINFLEDSWKLQSLYEEIKENQANGELDRCEVCFVNLIKHHVSACVEELGTSIDSIKTFVDNLRIFSDRSVSAEDNGPSKQSNPRKYLEEEYLETEKKVVAAFNLADNIRTVAFSNQERTTRRDDPEVKKLFAHIDKLRVEFESVPRPTLQIEIQKEKETRGSRSRRRSKGASTVNQSEHESPTAVPLITRLPSDSDSELAKFDPAYQEHSAEEISGWEFDEFED